jgi:hypothetical protein
VPADFSLVDEAAWPCAPFYRERHAEAVDRGRKRMAESRAVFCGLARDVADVLPDNVRRLAAIGRLFADFGVVVYENDSHDATPDLLAAWQAADERVVVRSERLGVERFPPLRDLARSAWLARCRNRARALALEHFGHFEWVIVVDLDLLGWCPNGIASSFGGEPFDVMGSNGLSFWRGRPTYYDAWALRTLDDPEPLDSRDVQFAFLPRGTPPEPVRSCFGGLAIYRMQAFRAACYAGHDCEHVCLHEAMRAAGHGEIFLNPSMIARYPDVELVWG